MRIHVLQHVAFEGPARIEEWAGRAGHRVATTRLYAHEPLPAVDDLDMLVVMGGPMGANDDHRLAWMKGEKLFIELAMERAKKVLGICLGAQLIAAILGAKVYPNPQKEIGWFPIELNPPNVRHHPLSVLPQRMNVFHWHGDTFDLPKGAAHLARSRACENQAFASGPYTIGLQFHLEMGMPHIETLLRHASADLSAGDYIMGAEEMLDLTPSQAPPVNAALYRFLDAFGHTR
jgi:GMP synthase-like glutamine amidotransferase